MKDLMRFYTGLETIQGNAAFTAWRETLPELIAQSLRPDRHGRISEWAAVLAALPDLGSVKLKGEDVHIRGERTLTEIEKQALQQQLMCFKPWRKGPFIIQDIVVDSEWRSDLKWDRLKNHIAPLQGRLVLDVGCGNGYHLWRMCAAGARAAIGIDPILLYVTQYYAIQNFIRSQSVFVLPFALESLPDKLQAFDTVFSMGVLYHRRSPLEHLQQLKHCLRPGGELVLETLTIAGDERCVLMPEGRYARMKNVWFIPSPPALSLWLQRSGFVNIRTLEVTPTTNAEQRPTIWSGDESLADFLDPQDPQKTLEGYPAPQRLIMLANAPC